MEMEEQSGEQEQQQTEGRGSERGSSSGAAKIESLGVNSRGINAVVKVVEKKDEKDIVSRIDGATHKVAEFLVGDPSGSIIMSLWDDAISQVEIGKTYQIENARVIVFNNSMRLSPGRLGKISPASEDIEANTQNNVSEKHVERPFRRFGGSGGSGGGRGGFGGGSRGGGSRFGDRDGGEDRGFGGGRRMRERRF